MVQGDTIVALVESIVSGRLSRRQALQRAGALGLGVAAASAIPVQLGGMTNEALAQEGGEIIVGVSQESVNFNPLLYTNTGPDTLPDVLMFDSLMKITPEGTFVPNLAVDVPMQENGGISEDGLTWTFTLRNDARWHDGEPFTSRDVQFTWETIMNPDVAVRSRTGHAKVSSVETPDDHTVVMTLSEPFAPFQGLWTSGVTGVIPAHILGGAVDVNTHEFNTQAPVGPVPFK